MKLVSYFLSTFIFYLFSFYFILIFKGDPLDFKDRVRACIVSVHDLDTPVAALSLTDLAKRSTEPLNSAKVTSLFASVADSDEIHGNFCSNLLFLMFFLKILTCYLTFLCFLSLEMV